MRCTILLEAAMGLAYLHSEEGGLSAVVHLDVKRLASSIMLTCTCTVHEFTPMHGSSVPTYCWMAP